MMSDLSELLDDGRLSGVHGISRALAPKRQASLVDRDDLPATEEVIELHCETWGGFCDLLLPCRQKSRRPPVPWMHLLEQLDVKTVCGGKLLSGKQLEKTNWIYLEGHSVGEPLLPLLAGNASRNPSSRVVKVPRLSKNDPWQIAYLGILGLLPDRPRARTLERLGYRDDLEWSDVIPTAFQDVAGSHADLLERLRDPKGLYPAGTTALYLQRASAARNAGIGGGPEILPRPKPDPNLVGPNIVVVYEPGSVADLCLIWALRAIHGQPAGLPLAVPTTENVGNVLDYWVDEFAPFLFGMGGDRRFRLVSASVPPEVLRSYVRGNRSARWAAADYRQFLDAPKNPARVSVDVASFDSGVGNVATWGPGDRDELTRGGAHARPELVSTISLQSHPLPPIRSLRPDYGFIDGPRGNGIELEAGDPNTIRACKWPTGWEVLEAAAQDKGLTAKPSVAGLAGASLFNALGALWEVRGFSSMPVVEMLNRLAERRGMSWFRERTRQMANQVVAADTPEKALSTIEAKLDQLSVRPFEGEERGITVDQVRNILNGDREAARQWIRWAESHKLVVRGVEIRCNKCNHTAWRALGELGPPVFCRGCGISITDPYREDSVVFRYRAGEPLLRAVEQDALTHVLSMYWWCELWSSGPGSRAGVFGGYPGVDLVDPESQQRVGEADVVLVLADGSLAVGECKRHGAGLNEAERDRLDGLAARLDARFSFVATTSWAADCPEIWKESIAPPPSDPPRYALTGEHLFELFPESTSLLAWPEETDRDHTKHHAKFVEQLPTSLGATREAR